MLLQDEKSPLPPAYSAPDYASAPSAAPNVNPAQPVYNTPGRQQSVSNVQQPPQQAYSTQPQFMSSQVHTVAQPPQQANAIQSQFTGNQPQTIPLYPQFTGSQPQPVPQHPQFTGNQPQTIPQLTGNQPQTIPLNPQFTGNQQQPIPQHPQQLYEMQGQLTGINPQSVPQGQGVARQASLGVGYPQPLMQQGGVPSPQQPQQPGMQGFGGTPQYYTATPLAILGQGSAPADCPVCRHRAMTLSNTEVGNTTHSWAIGFCLLFCLGCIPYLMSSTMDVKHNCGHCGALLATWHRSGRTVVHAHS